jgi:hypothetical protein
MTLALIISGYVILALVVVVVGMNPYSGPKVRPAKPWPYKPGDPNDRG